jgi:hypothetical protein
MTSQEGSVSEIKESFLSCVAATAWWMVLGNWLEVNGAWRNAGTSLQKIGEVGEDGMALLAAWQIEASKVGRRNVDDPKVSMLLVEVFDEA